MKRSNVIGKSFGKLTVLRRVKLEQLPTKLQNKYYGNCNSNERHFKKSLVECQCDCGNKTIIRLDNLVGGRSLSCGCVPRKHILGVSDVLTYTCWLKMIRRCYEKDHKMYEYFGGRGIKVCDEWLEFKGFVKDMGDRPDGALLERKDDSKGFSKSNCKWVAAIEQVVDNEEKDNSKISPRTGRTLRVYHKKGIRHQKRLLKTLYALRSTVIDGRLRLSQITKHFNASSPQRLKSENIVSMLEEMGLLTERNTYTPYYAYLIWEPRKMNKLLHLSAKVEKKPKQKGTKGKLALIQKTLKQLVQSLS